MSRLELASIAVGLLIASRVLGAESASDIPEVIVTATKRETNLQETPVAITVFSQAALDQNLVVDISDAVKYVPGVAYAEHGDQAGLTITMRGIGNDTAFTELDSPEVAMYVNGIYSPRSQGALGSSRSHGDWPPMPSSRSQFRPSRLFAEGHCAAPCPTGSG